MKNQKVNEGFKKADYSFEFKQNETPYTLSDYKNRLPQKKNVKSSIRKALFFAFLIQVPAMICGIDHTIQISYWYALLNTVIALAVAGAIVVLLSISGALTGLRDEENQTTEN